MYLKRLEIQGFKTFAARTVFEFQPGITAIVGPNGSGKSNLSDSIRWVLGEQSYSTLRSKRLEDLIFSGGGKRAPAGFAEVSLTIDNSDRLLALPYGEVTLTRRATRAGESEYFINRGRVRLRDIQEAIGPLGGSYTVINQGLVDAALTLRPEERRRLFEDAAEISAFESRKAESERRLRETDSNLERCADMLAELEPRLRSLKRQASLARSHRELSAELRVLLVQHYARLWREALRALAAAEDEQRRLEGELARRRANQAAATAELREAREQLRALRERLGALHAESSALHTRAEATQRDLAVGNERQAALARRGEEFERGWRELARRREELERERAASHARLADAEARVAQQRDALAARERELAVHADERRTARRALEQAQRAEVETAAALDALDRRAGQLASQRTRLAEEQAGHAAALATAEATLAAQQAALGAAQGRAEAAEHARAQAVDGAEQARAGLEALHGERARAEEAAAHARRALADIEARFETLGRLQRDYAGTFAGVRAAMQWAEAESRDGFVLVATLVRTPAHLETAVEVALGARLQNIVVERWQDAEDAIAALKRGGQGRATFLPLDTIRRPTTDDRRPTSTSDGVLGIAADLVEYDEHYRSVVQYLLGRTLIVRDLPTAREELRRLPGGWTIVTLAGEQISSGGAVTGGAQSKDSGTLRRARELRELPEQIAEQRQAVDAADAARAIVDGRIATAERTLQEAEIARRRAAQEYDATREALEQARRATERAEADLAWQHRRHEQAAADLADLDEQVTTLREERTALEARGAEAQTQLERLRTEEQAHAAGEREAQRELDALRAARGATEGEARAAGALLQSHNQNLGRLEEQRMADERRAAEHERERAALVAQLQALDQSHTALLTQIDGLRALISPAEATLIELEQAQADLEHQESERTTALLEGESAHGRAAVEVQRARDRRDSLWERAAADDIDIEADHRPPTTDHRSPITDDGQQTTDEQNMYGGPSVAASSDDAEDLQSKIEHLKSKIHRLGVVNPLALEEYEEAAERHTFLTTQSDDLRRAEAALRELIVELETAMRARFETTFRAVAEEFERSFTRLFGGGQAELLLVHPNGNGTGDDSHDGVEGLGVEILVRPPGKRQQTLSLLSGGERSLTASALLFAILKVNPSPFCVLDEVDAALDEANVGRFRDALADLAEQTQFLLVTHNRGTIESADTIYGVSMGEDGASRVLSLRLEELAKG
jgi:chromosome segregation protein